MPNKGAADRLNSRYVQVRLSYNSEVTVAYLKRAMANLDMEVRDEFLTQYGNRVVTLAKRNLADFTESLGGADDTGSSGDLSRTIRVQDYNGDTVTIVYGGDLPYGQVHNEPKGEFHVIEPVNAPKLVFPMRRYPGSDKPTIVAKTTSRPTSGYMREAVKTANRAAPGMLKRIAEKTQKEDYDLSQPYKLTPEGAKVWTLGSMSADKARKLGYITGGYNVNGRRTRGFSLTKSGMDYVSRRNANRNRR